jgi:hypothetical protein
MLNSFEQKTLRDPLLGMVADHLLKGKISCARTQQVGCELVALLAAYREEDRKLFPEVYLLGQIEEGDLLPVLAPGSPTLEIGEVVAAADPQTGARQTAVMAL